MDPHAFSVPLISSEKGDQVSADMLRTISLAGVFLVLAFLASIGVGFSQTSLAPSTLSFGNQALGQSSAPLTVTLKNSQAEPLTIHSITIGGGNAASDFTTAGNCPLSPDTLAAEESCRIAVTFTPSASGPRSATLKITDSRQDEPRTITLTGTGIVALDFAGSGGSTTSVSNIELTSQAASSGQQNASLPQPQEDSSGLRPAISGEGPARGLSPLSVSGSLFAPLTLSPLSLAFASDTVGITSVAQSVVITNHSNESYTLESSLATGDFAITGGTCSSTLSAGQSCSVAVAFRPTVVGTRTGALTLATSASSSPLQVTLSGVGNVNGLASITVTPANATIDSAQTQQFTAMGYFAGGRAQNLTSSVLWLSSASGVASISSSGLATGASGGSTTITATFAVATPLAGIGATPIAVSPAPISGSTNLSVTSSIPGAVLSGGLTFESEIQGNTSPSMIETLTNNGTGTLSIASIQVTGLNSGDFNIASQTCGSTLSSAGGSNTCTVTLTFKPQGTGTRSANLVFTDNAGNVSGSQQSASLSSQGLSPLAINNTFPPDAVVGTGYTFQLTASGGTGVYTWTIPTGQTTPGCLRLNGGTGYLVGNPLSSCVGSFTFNVEVTDSQGNQFTATINLNVDPAESTVCESGNESVLQGQYAFSEIGFENIGFLARVGSFVADGAGNIVSGEFDRNKVLGSTTTGPVTFTTGGTYTVGQDNRGCATIELTGGGSFTWRFVLNSISGTPATAAAGRLIEFDAATGNAFIASGQLFQQTTSTTATPSSFSALSGNYVHLMTGWDTAGNGGRVACDGVENDSAGSITYGEQYCNDQAGTLSGFGSGLGGSYTGVDQYGRFTESFGTTINLTGYLTSTAATGTVELTNSINGSDTAVLAGQTFQQTGGPYSQAALSDSGVYYVNGLNNSTSGTIEFALLSYTGSNGSGTITLDADYKNVAGTWVNNGTTGSCSYTFEGNGNGGASSTCGGMFYLYAPNTAVVVNSDGASSAGYVLPQTGGGSFTPSSIAGAFTGGTSEILSQSATSEDSAVTLAAGSGNAITGVSIGDDTSTTGDDTDEVNSISGVTISSTGFLSQTQGGTTLVGGLAVDDSHFVFSDNTNCSGSQTCFPTIELYAPSVADSVAVSITSPSSPQTVQAGSTLGLTLSVTGTSNTGVTWTINGVAASLTNNLSLGTVTGTYPSFIYTAPTRLPQPATFTLTATSNADVSQSASLTVTITAPASASTFAITTTSLPDGTVGTQYFQNIQTTGGTLPVSWSVVSGSVIPPGLFPQGQPNGLETISGIAGTQGTYTFTVKAADSSTPTAQTATQQFTVVINTAPLSITTTSLPNGIVGVPYEQFVFVTGGNPPYNFTANGLPNWASFNSLDGGISGTPTTNGTTIFSVRVTDSSLPTHLSYTQSLSLTVTTPEAQACQDSGNEAILSGQYAFSLAGFNSLGYQAVIGSFTADGSGHITAGELDTNGILGSGNYPITTGSSSYSVGSNNLGCATLATSFGTFNVRMSLGTFASSVATAGRLVEWDAPGASTYFSATGTLKQQTAADFSGGLPNPSSYAFALSGYESVPAALAGTFNVNGSGTLDALEEDVNVGGTFDDGTSTPYTGYTGTYSTFDSNGRATYSLQNGATSEGSGTVYMVSTSDLLDLAANKYLEGELVEQTVPNGGFGASSANGNMAINLTSLSSGSQGSVTLGLLDGDGISSMVINLYQDVGGTWQTPISVTCNYSVAANGRMTLTGSNCESTPVFYLTSTNTAFVLGTDTSMSFGLGEAQTGGPFSFSSIAGSYYFGDSLVVNNNVTVGNSIGVGALALSSSGGASGYSDYSGQGGQNEDTPLSGTLAAVNSNGTINFSVVGTVDGIVISNTKFILVDNETGTYPVLLILKQ